MSLDLASRVLSSLAVRKIFELVESRSGRFQPGQGEPPGNVSVTTTAPGSPSGRERAQADAFHEHCRFVDVARVPAWRPHKISQVSPPHLQGVRSVCPARQIWLRCHWRHMPPKQKKGVSGRSLPHFLNSSTYSLKTSSRLRRCPVTSVRTPWVTMSAIRVDAVFVVAPMISAVMFTSTTGRA